MGLGVKILIYFLVLLAAGGAIYLLYLGIVRDTRRLKIAKRGISEVEKKTFTDLLRKKFASANEKTHFAVVFVELNDAKRLKEEFGDKGYADIMLTLQMRIGRAFPHGAKICVYETDVFAVYVDGEQDEKSLGEFCARCLTEARKPIRLSKKNTLIADVNVGASSYNAFDGTPAQYLLNLDSALVNSKRKGPNQFYVFDSTLVRADAKDSAYYRELKQAIAENEFSLYFQPIYELGIGEAAAYESLLRWNHKRLGGMLQPVKFLHAMERSGDVNWVGLWAFEQLLVARQRYDETHDEAHGAVFSMNLSHRQLTDAKLCDEFLRILKRYSVSAKDICFEVGEGSLIDKSVQVKENIEKLRKCGFKVAIDNFGLDGKTLSFLENLEVDWIKLDKSLLEQARDCMVNEAALAELVALAEEHAIKLVAQGIEDAVTLEYVKGEGIGYGQGFYLGNPLPPEAYKL